MLYYIQRTDEDMRKTVTSVFKGGLPYNALYNLIMNRLWGRTIVMVQE